MLNFDFYNPTHIAFGQGRIADLATLVPADARVLILLGGESARKNGTLDEVHHSLLLRGVGLRIVGILITMLATIGGAVSVMAATAGQGLAWAALAGFLAVIVAGFFLLRDGPGWGCVGADRPARPKDLWKQIDEGIDPTSDENEDLGDDFETRPPGEVPGGRDSG